MKKRLYLLAMPLLLAACDNDNYEQGAQLIDLTTPVSYTHLTLPTTPYV